MFATNLTNLLAEWIESPYFSARLSAEISAHGKTAFISITACRVFIPNFNSKKKAEAVLMSIVSI